MERTNQMEYSARRQQLTANEIHRFESNVPVCVSSLKIET